MALMQEIYQRVRTLQDPWVAPSLMAALPTADPVARHLIGLLLLEKRHPETAIALIEHYHRFPPDVQGMIVNRIADLDEALRMAIAAHDTPSPGNAVVILRKAGSPRLAHLLLHLLEVGHSDPDRPQIDPTLRRDAAECLLALCRAAVAPSNAIDPKQLHHLHEVVDRTLISYKHHQEPSVLQAWATLATYPGSQSASGNKAFSDPHHQATLRMRELLDQPQVPVMKRVLLSCLRLPALAAPALRGLLKLAEQGALADAVTDWHLLLLPRVQQAIRRVPAMADPLRLDPASLHTLPQAQVLGLVQWVMALPISAAQRVAHLTELATSPDATVRLAVLRHLIGLSDDPAATGARASINRMCSDASPDIARLALRHMIRLGGPALPKLLLTMSNSPHVAVRELALDWLAPMGFARLWQAWPRLSNAQQLSAGRALIKIDAQFHRMLADKLTQQDRGSKLRALSMVQVLNQAPFFEPALLTMARDVDPRIVASAVRCLGQLESPAASAALDHALSHSDSRVRANAVEAMNHRDVARHVERLVTMASTDANRPRANAISALMQMRTSDALAALTRMLQDARAEHRASALWLVETMGLMEVASHVAEMSLGDPDPQVQTRADKAIQTLLRSTTMGPGAQGVSLFRARSA